MILEVAKALNFLHARGVVHMDVKANNVLLTAVGAAGRWDVGVLLVGWDAGLALAGRDADRTACHVASQPAGVPSL